MISANKVKKATPHGGYLLRRAHILLLVVFMSFNWPLSSTLAQEAEEGAPEEKPQASVDMDPLSVSILDSGRLVGRLNVTLVLETRGDNHSVRIKQRMPQIRSDFLAGLSQLARARFSTTQPVSPRLIKQYLKLIADRRLGEDTVEVFVVDAHIAGS